MAVTCALELFGFTVEACRVSGRIEVIVSEIDLWLEVHQPLFWSWMLSWKVQTGSALGASFASANNHIRVNTIIRKSPSVAVT